MIALITSISKSHISLQPKYCLMYANKYTPRGSVNNCDRHSVRIEILGQSRRRQQRRDIGREVLGRGGDNQARFSSATVSGHNDSNPSPIDRVCGSSVFSPHWKLQHKNPEPETLIRNKQKKKEKP